MTASLGARRTIATLVLVAAISSLALAFGLGRVQSEPLERPGSSNAYPEATSVGEKQKGTTLAHGEPAARRLSLEPSRLLRSGPCRVHVMNAEGEPLASASVRSVERDQPERHEHSDLDGVIEVSVRGSALMMLTAPGMEPLPILVAEGAELAVTMSPALCSLTLEVQPESTSWTTMASPGRFELVRISEGRELQRKEFALTTSPLTLDGLSRGGYLIRSLGHRFRIVGPDEPLLLPGSQTASEHEHAVMLVEGESTRLTLLETESVGIVLRSRGGLDVSIAEITIELPFTGDDRWYEASRYEVPIEHGVVHVSCSRDVDWSIGTRLRIGVDGHRFAYVTLTSNDFLDEGQPSKILDLLPSETRWLRTQHEALLVFECSPGIDLSLPGASRAKRATLGERGLRIDWRGGDVILSRTSPPASLEGCEFRIKSGELESHHEVDVIEPALGGRVVIEAASKDLLLRAKSPRSGQVFDAYRGGSDLIFSGLNESRVMVGVPELGWNQAIAVDLPKGEIRTLSADLFPVPVGGATIQVVRGSSTDELLGVAPVFARAGETVNVNQLSMIRPISLDGSVRWPQFPGRPSGFAVLDLRTGYGPWVIGFQRMPGEVRLAITSVDLIVQSSRSQKFSINVFSHFHEGDVRLGPLVLGGSTNLPIKLRLAREATCFLEVYGADEVVSAALPPTTESHRVLELRLD